MNPLVLDSLSYVRQAIDFLERYSGAFAALATLVIAAYTIVLARATNKLREISDRQVRAQINTERPWLFIYQYQVRQRRQSSEVIPNNWYISFVWRNFGRTSAVVDELLVSIQDIDTLPDSPDYSKSSHLPYKAQAVAAGETFETSEFGPGGPPMKDGKAIQYVVFGRLTYRDLIGNAHHVGFGMEVSAHVPAASTYRNRKYEYWD